ncbi:PEP-CTERM sorting domain-containing protein [Roseofilum capinflatum]|uniref:PEP-CTERM sorting domain-containing protein n=1 Tax=Roseofilum capinflatum BLCC-M114 TaxID=3022440 RepID=A0ABT7B1P3_9CYAN|nr:PEP-CTERM sorting domain-containing protein [Roseofilum capinflatum]MDJ1173049.1 PEP-CTERM sorting domain-containing protein [Roseofilum capinflatum BLCC-M114]
MKNSLHLPLTTALASVLSLAAFSAPTQAFTRFNAADDFSITDNPNNSWQYGWSSTLGSSFNLSTKSSKFTPTIDSWIDDETHPSLWVYHGGVLHNPTGEVNNSHPSITLQPNQLALHPGYHGEYSILRWIAPETQTYALSAAFSGLDHIGPTTTDVHVLHNGVSLFSDLINGFGASTTKSFNLTQMMEAGDTIDFAVGYGTNKTYWYDTTGIEATISAIDQDLPKPVPEPSAVGGLAFFGLLGLGAMFSRKRKSN